MAELNETKFMVVDSKTSFVTIASGQSVSSSFNAESTSLLGLYLPTTLTPGNLSIQVAKFQHDEPAYLVTIDGVLYSIAVAGGLYVPIPPYLTAACQRFKILMSSVQAQDVKIELALAPLFSAV